MHPFEFWIPAASPVLAIAHFVALLSPGPDFFLIAGHASRHRLAGSIYICLGIAVGNALYIAIAIAGWSGIKDNPTLFTFIEIIGAIYLLWLGSQLIRSRARCIEIDSKKATAHSPLRQLFLGFASAVLNPKNALFYMSLMTVILGDKVTLQQQIGCGIWMFMVVLAWDLMLAMLVSHRLLQGLLSARIHIFERTAGAVLMSFGIALLVRSK